MSDTTPQDAPSDPQIIVFGHKRADLPNPEHFIEKGVVENRFRYRYTQFRNARIIVLSREGLAFGHFEIIRKEKPDALDKEQFHPVKCVYIVGARARYIKPVQLLPILGKQVHSFGLKISASQFDKIKKAGHFQEFPKAELTGGWPASPDIAHNAEVEAAAIKCVRENLGSPSKDRQKDNCGWDLEFLVDGRTLCVEVKGLSGSDIGVELTPNEYKAMKRAMDGTFTEGDYRLAIVCDALSAPNLFLFRHEKEMCWCCERSQRQITASERTAVRLS